MIKTGSPAPQRLRSEGVKFRLCNKRTFDRLLEQATYRSRIFIAVFVKKFKRSGGGLLLMYQALTSL